MAGATMWTILVAFLSLNFYKIYGDSHMEQQELGSLTFTCKAGWNIYQSDCYLWVDVPMTWDSARDTCNRQGGSLFWFENELEYDHVKNAVAKSDGFWTGLKYDGGSATWSHSNNKIDLRTFSTWADSEPNLDSSQSCGKVDRQHGLGLKYCYNRLPFVCKYHACLYGTEPCATGGQCVMASDLCDIRHDCEDQSDERVCSKVYCNQYLELSDTSGSFSTPSISDGTHCTYVLEAPVGKRIRLTVPPTSIEENCVFVEISGGTPDTRKAFSIASLTGQIAATSYYSMNNFMTVLVRAGDITPATYSGITLSWTTTIPELHEGFKTEMADSTWKSLRPPFTAETVPIHLELSWKIEAPEGEVISCFLESYSISDQSSLKIQEGDMADDYTRTMEVANVKKNFYVSAVNTLQIHWYSGNGMSSFNLQYKTGCSMEINEPHGFITPPRLWETSSYPSELTCEWTLTGGRTRGRALSVNFHSVDLDTDPRQTPQSKDQIQYFFDEQDVSRTMESTGLVYSSGGYLRIKFISDLIIHEGTGFSAEFSIDCSVLSVSQWTRSSMSTSYGSTTTFSCETGYRFDAEEYYTKAEVDLYCNPGGEWSYEGKFDIRYPNCQVVQCGVPDEINNGYIKSVTNTSYGGMAEYECNDGFAKNHMNPSVCGADGNWQDVPLCTSSTCLASDVQNVVNGNYEVEAGNEITRTTVDFDTVVKFVCNPGYELIGSIRSHCRNQGWSDPKPECRVKYCPPPVVMNAEPISSNSLMYQASLTVTCKAGYGIDGTNVRSMTVTCGSDRVTSPTVQCLNIDECTLSSPCDSPSTTCTDTDGSYKCECRDGFEPSTSTTSCIDIKECSDGKRGGCSHTCNEISGSYSCSCPTGWTLFTVDGTSGFNIPAVETGNQYGDVYYLNHTCVKKSCARPADVDHGTLLSTKNIFYYGDSFELVCDDGYHITGALQTTSRQTSLCDNNGWNSSPSCSARTCSTGGAPNRGRYDKITVSFGEKVTLTCQWTDTTTITKTAICIYENKATRFGGDDITSCPEIDCGNPLSVLAGRGVIVGQSPASTKHLDHQTFTFGCQSGSELHGKSESNDTTVTCKENGRWSLASLSCSGLTCSDPGTPGNGVQIVNNYEVGQTLYYTCNHAGFEPDPKLNYTCEYSSGSAAWSNNLANNLPQCKDVAKPEITNVQQSPVYRDYMEPLGFDQPVFSDNFGLKLTRVIPDYRSTDIVSRRQIITYMAEDYEGNTQSATVTVETINRSQKPSLSCPNNLVLDVNSQTQDNYDVKQNVQSDGILTFNKEMVTRSLNSVGTAERIDVTARNQYGTEAYCSFLVTFAAAACFEVNLHPDSNAVRNCDNTGNGGLRCRSTCNSGYIYGDGQTVKTFTCSGRNVWNTGYPHAYCLPTINPTFRFTATVLYDYISISSPCTDEFDTAMRDQKPEFERKMNEVCTQLKLVIISYTALGRSSFHFVSEFSVRSSPASNAEIADCENKIRQNLDIFGLPNNELYCNKSLRTDNVTVMNSTISFTMIGCQEGADHTVIQSADAGQKCVPCGPGLFYDSSTGNCLSCPNGQFQDVIDGTCKVCPSGQTPNSVRTECVLECPAGFTSATGLLPCTPCPGNTHWVNPTACASCPGLTSTSGREGAVNQAACYESCPAGQYSQTGYKDVQCKLCPQNFYQPSAHQTTCLECPDGEVTEGTGQTSSASCQPYPFDVSDIERCFPTMYQDKEGGNEDEIANSEKDTLEVCKQNCLNEPACLSLSYFSREGVQFCKLYNRTKPLADLIDWPGGQHFNKDCSQGPVCDRTYCSNHGECEFQFHRAVCTCDGGYTGEKCESTYHICDVNPCLNGASCTSTGSYLQYSCSCGQGFGGQRCELDEVNGCDTSQCHSSAMCMDKVNGYQCLCPSAGGYTGQYCDVITLPCDGTRCQHDGTCEDFGDVQYYECSCQPGYTGVNCETNINECGMNPGSCLYDGTCIDGTNTYSCSCSGGFSGGNCENPPDYCSSKTCLGNTCYNSLDDRSGVCECESPYYISTGSGDCEATTAKPCDYVPCSNGVCNSQTGLCVCNAGYTGSLCQHSIDDCAGTTCINGNCVDGHMTATCSCLVGYTGDQCQTNINDCSNQCVHGQCFDLVNGFRCDCNAGYTGTLCETEIDECSSNPCEHGGTCTEQVNGYSCSCSSGWTGNNCERWVDHCQPAPCHNNGECYSLATSSFCRCGGGTQGEFCEDLRGVCETLSQVDVCVNGGACENRDGSAICQCSSVSDMDRCFCTVYLNKEGGNEAEIANYENITLNTCKENCLASRACKSLSYFQREGRDFCKLYNRTTAKENLIDWAGGQHFDKNCPTDYAGKACELSKDWCAQDPSPCGDNCQCITVSPRGFRCDCPTGYTGLTCATPPNLCSGSPCPVGATCKSSVTQYYCQCPQGQELKAGSCRTSASSGSGFVILLNNAYTETADSLSKDIPTLKTPFRLVGDQLSVMFRVRVHKKTTTDSYNLLRLKGSEQVFPLQDTTPMLELTVTNRDVTIRYNSETFMLPFTTSLDDYTWHHVGFSLASDGEFSYTVDAVEGQPQRQFITAINMDLNAQVILGDPDMVVEFKHVTVWQTAFSNMVFAQASADENYTPAGMLAQGWWNYKLSKASKLLMQALDSHLYGEDKSVPQINCDISAYKLVSSERIVSCGGLTPLIQRIESMSDGQSYKHSLPEVLTWGYYSCVVVVEGSNGRFADCRFPVYIKYHDKCPAPVHGSDVSVTPCDTTSLDGVCGLPCIDQNKYVSAAIPRYQSCGALGVYDWTMPYQKHVLPSCVAANPPKYIAEVFMQYDFVIDCPSMTVSFEEVKTKIRETFIELKKSWKDICVGTDCSNLVINQVVCTTGEAKSLDIKFSISFDSEYLDAQITASSGVTSDDGKLKLVDALKSIIVLEEEIDLSGFASATLVPSTVSVTMNVGCTTQGQDFLNNRCVPCGKGLYYSSASEECEFCELGSYDSSEGTTTCTPCGSGASTVSIGARSISECIGECDPGNYYNETKGSCDECPINLYQNQAGQSFCIDCKLGFITEGTASDSDADCIEDCQAGFARSQSGQCVQCPRGYWRDLNHNECQKCERDYTTKEGEVAICKEQCTEVWCDNGREYRADTNSCENCPLEYYKNVTGNTACQPCPPDTTTTETGQATCKPYCGPGKTEVNNKCVYCSVGYYKSSEGNGPCTKCPDLTTTAAEGAISQANCSIDICPTGEYRIPDQQTCTKCPLNFYQDETGQTSCKKCDSNKVTMETGSKSSDDCVPECQAGEEYNHGSKSCDKCQRGHYKNNTGNFERCVKCPTGYTTIGEGATSVLACNRTVCQPGSYEKEENGEITCPPCPIGEYQPEEDQSECIDCDIGFTTMSTGRVSKDECVELCVEGKYWSDSTQACVNCPKDTYKDAAGQTECTSCPELTFNDMIGAKSANDCREFCRENPQYCNERGICTEIDRRNATCTCDENYTGLRCATKLTPESTTTAVIGGTIGGLIGLLVIIVIIIAVLVYCPRKPKENLIVSRNPMYNSFYSYTEEGIRPKDPTGSADDTPQKKSGEDVYIWEASHM